MKNIKIITLALLAFYSSFSSASIINVLSSNGAFAGNSSTDLTTLSLLSEEKIANVLSDNNNGTYFFGSSLSGTVSNASLTLAFQDTVVNESGADIAFYFLGGSEDTNSMHVCFTSNCNPTDTTAYDATIINTLGVNLGEIDINDDPIIYALSAITLDLSDFGFADDETVGNFSIDLIAGGYNNLTGIESLNTVAPVPLPTAAWLFLSGLSVFGWFGRRK